MTDDTRHNPPRPLSMSVLLRMWRLLWMLGAGIATTFVVASILWPPPRRPASEDRSAGSGHPAVDKPEVAGRAVLRVAAGAPLLKRLEIVTLEPEITRQPKALVSGVVAARVRSGSGPLEDRWQFGTALATSLYSDYQRGRNEVVFATQQLDKTRELLNAETGFLRSTVERLGVLAQSASIPQKEFIAAQAALLKAQIQGEKDVYAAEADLRTARKNLTAIERGLAQNGIEPEMLSRTEEHMVILSADVPEVKMGLISIGQECEVRFYGLPDRTYAGHVEQLGSTVTPERRTLRIFFHVDDPQGELRPGMFGEVAVGTEERRAIRILETAVLHVDLQDFVLVSAGVDMWRAVPVRIGEGQGGRCEVIEGLAAGDRVIERGAILLKSLVVQSLSEPSSAEDSPRP